MSSFLVGRRPNDSVLRNSCHGNRILSSWIPWYSPKPSSGQLGTKGNRSKHQTRLLSLGLSDLDGSQHTNNCWQALSSILVQGWNVNLAYGQGKATRCMSQFVSLNKGSGIRKYTLLCPPFKEIVHVHSGIRRAHPKSDSGRSESAFGAWVVNRHFCWQGPH